MKNYELVCGDSAEILMLAQDESFDMALTSPPYDSMRTYGAESFNFPEEVWKTVLDQIYRTLKVGGVLVWIVGDQTVNGGESGTSFRQAIYAQSIGFRIHDTMIWNKGAFTAVGSLKHRYASVFEYMFILSKGAPKSFTPIKDRPNKHAGKRFVGTIRLPDGSMKPMSKSGIIAELGQRYNIWDVPPDKKNKNHPAPFPLSLAQDHISSWSVEGDLVVDPFCGSGTSGVAALSLGRRFFGVDISPQYISAANSRIDGSLRDPRKVGNNDTKRPDPKG